MPKSDKSAVGPDEAEGKKAGKAADRAKSAEVPLPKSVRKAAKAKSKSKDAPSLVIVESPAKERTISRFLNKEFLVKSSYGHVRDLPVKKIGVSVEKGFAPEYVVLPRAKKILAELKSLAAASPAVYLATDHDREGESIAWHLVELLKLPLEKVRRITFHEITPTAISEALASPRGVDSHLVSAQQARRVIDRLVGYKLSPLLWAKIQSGLSAGRVQSVATRLLAERDAEIKNFVPQPYWTLAARLEREGQPPAFEAQLTHWKGEKIESTQSYELFAEPYRVKLTSLKSEEDVDRVKSALAGGAFTVTKVDAKEAKRRPAPPFATSTMQQAAAQRLYFAAERTMRVAQSLYEGVDLGNGDPVGLITYMRTDSLSVAKGAQAEAAQFIREKFGASFAPAQPPTYQTRSTNAQEAHEAIRPTSVLRAPEEMKKHLNRDQARLYELIWQRFVASQMTEAVYDTMSVDVASGDAVFHAVGRTLKFAGFLKAFLTSIDEEEKGKEEEEEEQDDSLRQLPVLREGETLKLVELKASSHSTSPPPFYNEASLIRAMERHGIGRPSTYAPTLQTITQRGYVQRSFKDRRLLPTQLGILVTQQLKQYFPDVVSLSYTAQVERGLDAIAEGKQAWTGVVEDFYSPFAKALESAAKEMKVIKQAPQKSDEKCPLCGSPMLIRESRFGKYLSCETFPRCKGKIQLTVDGQKIVPEKTGELCTVCGKEMVIRSGRKGRFLACSGFPKCRNTYSLDAEGKKIEGSQPVKTSRNCQKCGSAFWLRLGKRGFFLACSGFPKCRNIKPVSKDEAERLRAEAPPPAAQA